MAEVNGFIKYYRKILDNPIICKDSEHFAIWSYLLLNATHTEQEKMFNGQKITLKKGQLITSRKSVSDQFNISESKCERVFKLFKNEQMIEQQTCSKNRLITIVKWNDYQSSEQQNEQQLNNKWTTTEQQVDTNNKDKKEKKDKNDNKKSYGTFKNVKLTELEFNKLSLDYPKLNMSDLIQFFDNYIEEKGYKSKSHNLAIRRWVVDAFTKDKPKRSGRVEQLSDYTMPEQPPMTLEEEQAIIDAIRNIK